jgi:hypothetical protein
MSATSRLKQLLFIAAALALVALGLVAALSPASPARADEPCVETQDGYTEWVQTGTIVQHGDATPPGTNTDLKEYRGPTETKHVTQEFEEGTPEQDTRVWWVFRGQNGDAAPAPGSDLWRAQPNLPADQSQHSYPGENGLGNPYQPGANAGSGDWFRFTGALIPAGEDTPEESHTDYTWTVWEREFVEGNDCPAPPDDKKVVVCKYVGTPPGTPDHIIVVSVASLGEGFTGTFPFPFGDAQDSIAIRFAVGNEQPGDEELVNCPVEEEPEVCPKDTDKEGQVIPDGKTAEEFCDEEDPEVCPKDTDKEGQVIPDGKTAEEFCDDEDVDPGPDCEEDPTQEHCDEDDDKDCEEDPNQEKCDNDNPPVVNPDDGTTPNGPSNQPNNGPTVKGAQATTTVAGAAAGTPAVQVPTAVNSGLSSPTDELAGNGGTFGLLGIVTALLGAALVGLTVRPRQRRART